jgi:hypothetical protein
METNQEQQEDAGIWHFIFFLGLAAMFFFVPLFL